MKKTIFLLCTVLLFCLASMAQTTYYYKLTKKKVNGVISEKVSGGQFITIAKKGYVCYESDKDGFSVNHGRMDYKTTENGIQVYEGASYYGDHTILLFKSDYSSFNIKTMNGDVYVYKRATPPAGVTTCSLIRKPTPSGSSDSGSGYVPPVYPQTTYTPTTSSTTTTSSSSSSSSSSQPATTTPAKRECIRCHGTGRQEYEGVTYGLDTKYCSECRRAVPSGHYHGPCQLCNGKGYY